MFRIILNANSANFCFVILLVIVRASFAASLFEAGQSLRSFILLMRVIGEGRRLRLWLRRSGIR